MNRFPKISFPSAFGEYILYDQSVTVWSDCAVPYGYLCLKRAVGHACTFYSPAA